FDHLQPGTVEPDVNAEIRFLYEDANLIVLEKPAPLPMHASGRFNRNTLRYLINQIYYPERPHMIHRLDANTSGILLLCRRQWVARQIQKQFENRSVEKVYLAKVHGHPDR
ncbi:MAG: pseudouridine synthase, partial [Phycisphaerae bacterium]